MLELEISNLRSEISDVESEIPACIPLCALCVLRGLCANAFALNPLT
jgi:hypothetical protein